MNSPYKRNDKNQNKVLTCSSSTNKNIDSDLEALAKLKKDYPSYLMIGYLNINSIKNKIVQLTDICKTSLIEILCIDETKLGGDYMFPACRDEISTRPAETDFTLRLHVEIKFRPGKAGQFSTWDLIKFECIFFGFFFVSILFNKIEDS